MPMHSVAENQGENQVDYNENESKQNLEKKQEKKEDKEVKTSSKNVAEVKTSTPKNEQA